MDPWILLAVSFGVLVVFTITVMTTWHDCKIKEVFKKKLFYALFFLNVLLGIVSITITFFQSRDAIDLQQQLVAATDAARKSENTADKAERLADNLRAALFLNRDGVPMDESQIESLVEQEKIYELKYQVAKKLYEVGTGDTLTYLSSYIDAETIRARISFGKGRPVEGLTHYYNASAAGRDLVKSIGDIYASGRLNIGQLAGYQLQAERVRGLLKTAVKQILVLHPELKEPGKIPHYVLTAAAHDRYEHLPALLSPVRNESDPPIYERIPKPDKSDQETDDELPVPG